MAKRYDITNLARFDANFIDYNVAKAAAEAIAELPASRVRYHIYDVLHETRQSVLAVPAPRLGDVAEKLMVYWGGDQLFQDDSYGADWRLKSVGDIRRIEIQLAGVEEPDASAGYDMEKVARDWTGALQQYERWSQLLAEGRSDQWDDRKQSDIVAFKDDAEEALLSLPAPHLLAVTKKLEILWADQRFGAIDDSADHFFILRDLRWFALKHQQ